jgi:hypothetical protein
VAAFSMSRAVTILQDLKGTKVDVGSGTYVQVDAASSDHAVLLEAYARQGKLKGAQLEKIAQDILEFALIKKVRTVQETDAYIVFASDEARASICGWLLTAAYSYDVQLVTVDIDDELRGSIIRAQGRQIMINASPLADDLVVLDELKKGPCEGSWSSHLVRAKS